MWVDIRPAIGDNIVQVAQCCGMQKVWCWNVNGAPEVFSIWGGLFIFRELGGGTDNYFSGNERQAHSFGDLGSPAIK